MSDIIMSHIFHSAYTEKALASIGSGHKVILIDNSYSGEMGLYARRNTHIEYVRVKLRKSQDGSNFAWQPLSCSESWNLATRRATSEWVININPDVLIFPKTLAHIEQAIEAQTDPDVVLCRAQLNFNVWWARRSWLLEHPFDDRYRPCGGEDEDMLCQIATAGKKAGKGKAAAVHMDGGHLNRVDGYCNVKTFRNKWGFPPHSPEYRALVGGEA